MVAYYLRKWDFDSKDSKWVFWNRFLKESFEKSVIFKIREINLRTIKRMRNRIPIKTNGNKITK